MKLMIFTMLVASLAIAQKAPLAPKLAERRDTPLQITWIEPARIPGQCKYGLLASSTCTKVWARVDQSFDKTKKHLRLLLNVTSIDDLTNRYFTSAAIVFAIDGNISNFSRMEWEAGDPWFLYGSTVAINDESLVRSLANATEVWVTVLLSERLSVKLNPNPA
jgi:hypothetical protein